MATYKVRTASGEHEWTGSPVEIVSAMATLDFEGGLNGYMDRVRRRVAEGFELIIKTTDDPLKFLRELAGFGFITIEKV